MIEDWGWLEWGILLTFIGVAIIAIALFIHFLIVMQAEEKAKLPDCPAEFECCNQKEYKNKQCADEFDKCVIRSHKCETAGTLFNMVDWIDEKLSGT